MLFRSVAGVCAMLPGMSISMILMSFGTYTYLLTAAKTPDVPIILLVGACFVLAMILSSKFSKFMVKNHDSLFMCLSGGLMCGTLVGIFVTGCELEGFLLLSNFLILFAGLAVSFLFVFLGKKMKT